MAQKTLVITGASRGIGFATAQTFVAAGYQVVNLSRSKPAIDAVHHIAVDLAQTAALSDVASELEGYLDQSDEIVLVHNAGLLLKDTVADIDADHFRRVMQINVIAASELNTLVLPKMKRGSSIIYIGSTLSEKGVANTCSYVTSKHAVLGLMRATCQDLVGEGIHTACICPGFTETEMLSDHVGGSREVLNSIAEGIALKRLAEPPEIADTIYFAATHPVINGAILHANLGQVEH